MFKSKSSIKRAADAENLKETARALISTMQINADLFPINIRHILADLKATKLGEKPEFRVTIVGAFFFLRFLCPALITPEQYFPNLPNTAEAKKSLLLLSKFLQCASARSKMTSYSELDPAIVELAPLIDTLLDTISSPPATVAPSVECPSQAAFLAATSELLEALEAKRNELSPHDIDPLIGSLSACFAVPSHSCDWNVIRNNSPKSQRNSIVSVMYKLMQIPPCNDKLWKPELKTKMLILALKQHNWNEDAAVSSVVDYVTHCQQYGCGPNATALSMSPIHPFVLPLLHARTVDDLPVLYVDPTTYRNKADLANITKSALYMLRVLSECEDALNGYALVVNAEFISPAHEAGVKDFLTRFVGGSAFPLQAFIYIVNPSGSFLRVWSHLEKKLPKSTHSRVKILTTAELHQVIPKALLPAPWGTYLAVPEIQRAFLNWRSQEEGTELAHLVDSEPTKALLWTSKQATEDTKLQKLWNRWLKKKDLTRQLTVFCSEAAVLVEGPASLSVDAASIFFDKWLHPNALSLDQFVIDSMRERLGAATLPVSELAQLLKEARVLVQDAWESFLQSSGLSTESTATSNSDTESWVTRPMRAESTDTRADVRLTDPRLSDNRLRPDNNTRGRAESDSRLSEKSPRLELIDLRPRPRSADTRLDESTPTASTVNGTIEPHRQSHPKNPWKRLLVDNLPSGRGVALLPLFEGQPISSDFNSEKLKEMGVTVLGERLAILKALKALVSK